MTAGFASTAELHSLPVLLNPYPFYHWVRSLGPVHWSDPLQAWLVTGHDAAGAALRDRALSSRIDIMPPDVIDPETRALCAPLVAMQRRWMQQSDPPEHTRIRAPWARLFGPAAAEGVEAELTDLARDLVARAVQDDTLDIVETFEPFPALVVTHLLGLERDDMARFRPWVDAYVRFRHAPGRETGEQALAAVAAWRAALAEVIDRPSRGAERCPLREIRDLQGEEQMFATVTSLLSGRYEPTIGLIGNGMLALLGHPGQHRADLCSAPRLQDTVDEMLRYDCPFQSAVREVREDTALCGHPLRAGQRVLVLLGAANRDPARFEEPDAFRVDRGGPGHLGFGLGAHFCLGQAVALAMVRAAVGALVELLPGMRLLARRPDWHFEVAGYRALRTLPVALR
ncbi:cytochrome P450 [Methylobacterium sp. sgz302541]|uniref:cytochrome P450 n=1 Tax=unclassified Methylobacterium TaxID=2615210 RepID=UPI003D34C824